MPLVPWTTCSLALVGDDLFITVVNAAVGVSGAREHRAARIAGFASMHAIEQRAALVPHRPPRSARLCVLLPASMISVRRMPLGVSSWSRARAELLGSIEKLLPIERDHAALGLVDRVVDPSSPGGQASRSDSSRAQRHTAAGDRGSGGGGDGRASVSVGHGYLLGADERAVRALLEPIESAFGRACDAVLAWPHALLGLGTQREPRAIVLDEAPPGVPVHHELRGGRIARLAEPGHPAASPSTTIVLAMPGVQPTPSSSAAASPAGIARRLDGFDLATAAAIAERVAPESIAPLRGRAPSSLARWSAGVAAALLGAGLLVAAGRLGDARADVALADIRAASAAIAEDLRAAEQRQARVVALADSLMRIDAAWSRPDTAAIEAYRALRDAVPDPGFIYRVVVDPARITLAGEAPRAAEVLAAVENSPLFQRATMRPPDRVPERPGMESFEITAERVAFRATSEPSPAALPADPTAGQSADRSAP